MGELNNSKVERSLTTRLLLDTTSAFTAAFCVTPIIAHVDVAVTATQSGKSKMSQAFLEQIRQIALTPHKYVTSKPFLWIFTVYSTTYTANNCIDSLCKIYHFNDVIPKLIGITAINMYTSILKDSAFAKIFGTKPPSKVPLTSLGIWALRDVVSMAAAFILPQRLAKYISERNKTPLSKAEKQAQFASPMLMQFLILPVHLIGLDFYNVDKSNFMSRLKRIIPTYPKALPLRFYRMGGAYGVGGVNNKKFRNYLISKYEGKNWDSQY